MGGETIVVARDKATFALRVEFEAEPDKGEAATEEERYSWGSVEIWVRGKNLCKHLEQEEVVDSSRWGCRYFLSWAMRHAGVRGAGYQESLYSRHRRVVVFPTDVCVSRKRPSPC